MLWALIALAAVGQVVFTSLVVVAAFAPAALLYTPAWSAVSMESTERSPAADAASETEPESVFDRSDVIATRYAPDGVGIYYLMEYTSGEVLEHQVGYLKTVDSAPTTVSVGHPSVPRDIEFLYDEQNASFAEIDDNAAVAAKIGPPPGGKYIADLYPYWEESGVPLSVDDAKSGLNRMVKVWPSGELSAGLWLDDETLLVALSMRDDDSASIELVSVGSKRSETVFTVPYTPYIDRMVFDPEGFVLFDVDTSVDEGFATLYRYDVRTRRVQRVGSVRDSGAWDYCPARNTIVEPDAAGENGLVERPLPVP